MPEKSHNVIYHRTSIVCGVYNLGAIMVVISWQLDLQLADKSVHIITKIVSSNPAHGEVYSIQHYVIFRAFWFRPLINIQLMYGDICHK
jgi:hypothetical protein